MARAIPSQDHISHRTVWVIAGPIVLSNASTPLMGAVDTGVVGHLGTAVPIAAIALGALVFSYVAWVFGFLRSGTTALAGQAFGAKQEDELTASLIRAGGMGFLIGSVLLVLGPVIANLALSIVDAAPEVEAMAAPYISLRLLGAPAQLASFALIGWFMGRRESMIALILQLVLNGTNMVLDLWFVIGLDMGVNGVAIASAIAEWVTLFVGLTIAAFRIHDPFRSAVAQRLQDWGALAATLKMNGDLFIRALFLTTAFAFFTAQSATFGTTVMAANAILLNLLTITAYGLDGFAIAAEALVGSAYGARNRPQLAQAVKLSSLWAAFTALLFCTLWIIAAPFVFTLMTNVPQVHELALTYLPWLVALPIAAVLCFQLDGIFIGLGATRTMRNRMIFSFSLYIALWYLLTPLWGVHGLWAAFISLFVIRGFTLLLAYRRDVSARFDF